MSLTKSYYESLAELAAIAIHDECIENEPYYEGKSVDEIRDEIENQLFDGNADDVMDELIGCMFYYNSDLVAEYPKSFSACCALYPTENPLVDDRWHSLIGGASNQPVFNALIAAYDEYRDMGDPWLNEAKEWIGELMYHNDYSGLLDDINAVIENYELTEEESPVTFKAKTLLESVVS